MSALPDSSSDLERVRSLFEQWRARRSSPRERIPIELWDAALALLEDVPLLLVARSLGLASHQLRKRRDALADGPRPQAAPLHFLQLPVAALTPADAQDTGSDATARLVIERPDGARLCLTIPAGAWDRLDTLCARFFADAP